MTRFFTQDTQDTQDRRLEMRNEQNKADFRRSGVWLGAALFVGLSVVSVACASGGGTEQPATGGAGGSGAGGAGGGVVVTGGGSGEDSNLDPWKYYDESGEHGYKDVSLGDDVREQFGGPSSDSGKPQLVYPLSNSMHAMNLDNITFQWTRGDAASRLFRIEATVGSEKYYFFVPCEDAECTYKMPRDEWLTLGKEFAGDGDIAFSISGTAGDGASVATSDSVPLSFSPGAVRGALYYWASKGRTIKRATFGSDHAVPFIVPNSATNDYDCAGCHSVSRDGKVIAFAVGPEGGENIAGIQTAPTEAPDAPYIRPAKGPTPFPSDIAAGNAEGPLDHFGHNVALSPDGAYAAVNGIPSTAADGWPPFFEVRHTVSGETIVKHELYDPIFGSERLPILPEWSPDGTKIAVTLTDATGDDANFGCVWTSETCRSSIAIVGFDGAAITAPEVLVVGSGGEYHFYPTWSPDGRYIAFASGRLEMGVVNEEGKIQKSQSNPNAILRLVPTTGGPHACPGPTCYELTNGMQYSSAQASSHTGLQSTWPKFTPFAQGDGGSVMFISFNTKVDYGFLSHGENQIWMFAIDTAKLGSGDPSYAPVWLPYQDIDDGSLTPYWTETLPCDVDPQGSCAGCVEGETCVVDEQANRCQCEGIIR